MSQILTDWLNGELIPKDAKLSPAQHKTNATKTSLNNVEWNQLEIFLCRAVWTIVVALSPSLDESAVQTIVNELMRPLNREWKV